MQAAAFANKISAMASRPTAKPDEPSENNPDTRRKAALLAAQLASAPHTDGSGVASATAHVNSYGNDEDQDRSSQLTRATFIDRLRGLATHATCSDSKACGPKQTTSRRVSPYDSHTRAPAHRGSASIPASNARTYGINDAVRRLLGR